MPPPTRTVADGPVCARPDENPEVWFDADLRAVAKRLCKQCPVRAECLVESQKLNWREEDWGVWGGMVPRQRKKIKERYGIVTLPHARALLGVVG